MPIKCDTCGKEINKAPSQIKAAIRHFCSASCHKEFRRNCPKTDNLDRFWSKVFKTDSCWIWTGYRNSNGYGMIRRVDGLWLAHRYAWMIFNGPIPPGAHICHDCPNGDNPSCVNPDHLFLGTALDNRIDASNKKRLHYEPEKLTREDAELIRKLYATGKWKHNKLALEFGISEPHVNSIIHMRCWK